MCELVRSCPKDLIRPARGPEWFWFNERLLLLRRACIIGVSVKFVLVEFPRLDFHGLNLLEIFLVVETVSKDIAKCAQ